MKIYELEPRILFDGAAAVQTAEAIVAEMSQVVAESPDDSGEGNSHEDAGTSQQATGNSGSTQNGSPLSTTQDLTQYFIDNIVGSYDPIIDGENLLDIQGNALEDAGTSDSISNFQYTISNIQSSHQVAFINSSVLDSQQIVDSLGENVEVVYIDSATDGMEQISEYLSGKDDISAIHIISGGNEGYFTLGGKVVDSEYIATHTQEISQWKTSLTQDADILFYSCNLAKGADGQAMLTKVAELTGADTAGSTDLTGKGGDWNLEYSTGLIESKSISVSDYDHSLDPNYYTVASGAWSDYLNVWRIDGGATPAEAPNATNSHSITIQGGYTVLVTADVTIDQTVISSGGITVSTGKTLTIADDGTVAVDLANSGTMTNYGTLSLEGTVSGNTFSYGANSTLVYSGTSAQITSNVELPGTGVKSLTIDNAAGVTLNADKTLTGTITVSAGAALNIASNTLTPEGTFDATGGTVTLTAGGTLNLKDFVVSLGTLTDTTGTVNYSGTDQTILSDSYYNLVTSGSITKTLGGAITVKGDLTIGADTTLDVSSSNYAINLAGNWSDSGTFIARSGTVTLDGPAQSIGTEIFYDLTTSGTGTQTLTGNITVGNNLTVGPNTTLAVAANSATVTGAT